MGRLNEALDRIDASFLLALAGREAEASSQYQAGWDSLNVNLLAEQRNITVPGERELAERLASLSQDYKQQADTFFAAPVSATRSALFRPAELSRPACGAPGNQGGVRSHRPDQSRLDGARQPRVAPRRRFFVDRLRRWRSPGHRPGRVARGRHDPRDPLSDRRDGRIGAGDRRRRSRSIGVGGRRR